MIRFLRSSVLTFVGRVGVSSVWIQILLVLQNWETFPNVCGVHLRAITHISKSHHTTSNHIKQKRWCTGQWERTTCCKSSWLESTNTLNASFSLARTSYFGLIWCAVFWCGPHHITPHQTRPGPLQRTQNQTAMCGLNLRYVHQPWPDHQIEMY